MTLLPKYRVIGLCECGTPYEIWWGTSLTNMLRGPVAWLECVNEHVNAFQPANLWWVWWADRAALLPSACLVGKKNKKTLWILNSCWLHTKRRLNVSSHTHSPVVIYLCVFAEYTWRLLQGGRPHSSFLISLLTCASIPGNQNFKLVPAKFNICFIFELWGLF